MAAGREGFTGTSTEGTGGIAGMPGLEASEKWALYSVALSVFLAALKYALGVFSGSMALIADAIHSFADVVSSAAVFAGIRLSKRKSRSFPYGLYKIENLISVGISLLIFGAGFEIVKISVFQRETPVLARVPLSVAGYVCIMAMVYVFTRYELQQGRETGSPSLVADAQQLRADLLSYAVIVAGLIGSYVYVALDRVMTIVVAVFIARSGWGIFVGGIRVLLDASVDFATLDRVRALTLQDPNVRAIKELRGRSSGRYKFIEMVLTLKARGLEKAHYVSKKVEAAIKKDIENVDRILIHYEPEEKDTTTYAVPLQEDKGAISPHFGGAPFFALITIRGEEILEEAVASNPHFREEKRKGIMTGEWLVKRGVDVVLTKESLEGKGGAYALADAGVEMRVISWTTLDEAKNAVRYS